MRTVAVVAMLIWRAAAWCQPAATSPNNVESAREVGVVYYSDGGAFKAIQKEMAQVGGRRMYSGKVKGAHALVRLKQGHPHLFRVCGVDPTRYKLYRFTSGKNSRALTIARTNVFIGGSKIVLSESELPVTIEATEGNCYSITPKEALQEGEYGFSPAEANDVFMFGVGDSKRLN